MNEPLKPRALTIFLKTAMVAIPLGLLTVGAGLLAGCGKSVSASSPNPRPAMKVSVVKAETSNVPLTGEWVGTLDGYVNAQIQPQANGYLIRQDYREGTQVEKGQVLFEIDPRPFEAALEQAQGQLGQAQAQLALAQINVNRDTPLAEAHAIARSQLDNEIQQEAQAKATVETAEAAVATANLNLGFTKVRSLITGVAGQATTQVGNLVNTQSVLTSVSQLNPIKVYFSISDSEYLALTRRADGSGSDLLQGAVEASIDADAFERRSLSVQGPCSLRRSAVEHADRSHSNCCSFSESRQRASSGPVRPGESRDRSSAQCGSCTAGGDHRVSGPGADLHRREGQHGPHEQRDTRPPVRQ